jgi:hypothetical protein
MKSIIFWLLIAAALYFILRSVVADNRLPRERRADAPLWKVWFAPWRWFGENVYTEAGEVARRDVLRSTGWALILLLAAALVRAL